MANYPVTLAATNVSPLISPERLMGGYSVRYYIPYTAVAVATATGNADTVTFTLGTTPSTWLVTSALVDIPTAFAGTTAMTMTVGTTTTANAFIASTSVLTAGVIQPSGGAYTVNTPASATGTTSITLTATFTNATGGSPSALTAGFLTILLGITNPAGRS